MFLPKVRANITEEPSVSLLKCSITPSLAVALNVRFPALPPSSTFVCHSSFLSTHPNPGRPHTEPGSAAFLCNSVRS